MCASVVEYLRISFFAFLSLQRERDTRSVFRDCSSLPYRTFRKRLTASCKPMTMMTATKKKKKKKRREKEERTTTSEQHDRAHIQAEKARKRGRREKERVRNLCEIAVRPTHTVVADRDLSRCATPLRDCFRTDERARETKALSRQVGMRIRRDGRRRTRQLELEMGGQAPTDGDTGGTIFAFGQIINPEVLTFFAS
ncbi:hypothetical protein ALC53_00778 [Atta colombica]|uniref:Uncharacterized protein n=1 Tax=Atta colombica TaxID=520822 RepID=A0A195BWH6_9HYME|nr:hypothetical protein ALC53_00778 [Atta colombica]